jgi:HEAT repeat protein
MHFMMESAAMSKRKELLIAMLKDPSEEVRSAAAAALEKLEGILKTDEVLEQLKKGTLAEKIRAIYALGEIGGEKVLAPLVYCASRPEEDLKGAAIDALGTLAKRSTMPVLLEKLNDQSDGIRARAIRALGNFNDRSVIPSLLPFLDANDGLTDVEAALALAKTGDPILEGPLMQLARSAIPASRAAAATALGMIMPA